MQRDIQGESRSAALTITSAASWAVSLLVTQPGTYRLRVGCNLSVTASGGSLRTAIACPMASVITQLQLMVAGAAQAALMRAVSGTTSASISSTVYATTGVLPFLAESMITVETAPTTIALTVDLTSGSADLPIGTSVSLERISN